MHYHFYKTRNTTEMPPYVTYDFDKGVAAYEDKLSPACVTVHGMYYLGFGTESEVCGDRKSSQMVSGRRFLR